MIDTPDPLSDAAAGDGPEPRPADRGAWTRTKSTVWSVRDHDGHGWTVSRRSRDNSWRVFHDHPGVPGIGKTFGGRGEAIDAAVIHMRAHNIAVAGSIPPPAAGRAPGSGTRPMSNPLSFADAAESVLRVSERREPMHYQEITEKALADGLITTRGKTPAATLRSAIFIEIERRARRGEPQRFYREESGYIGLTEWRARGMSARIDEHNKKVHTALLARLHELTPAKFEELVGGLLGKLGFEEIERTSLTNDGGIDVRGTLVVADAVRIRMAVQVKRWKNNVQAPVVQHVRGSLAVHEKGLLITTSDFSSGARKEADRQGAAPIALMDGAQLVSLLIEHLPDEIGVRRDDVRLLELARAPVGNRKDTQGDPHDRPRVLSRNALPQPAPPAPT